MGIVEELLNTIYYKEKNYDSAKELYRKARLRDKNIKLDEVKEWLKKQSTHQVTTVKKIGKKEYKKIYSEDHFSFQIDLTFLPRYKSENKNNYVLFTAININSRYAYVNFGKDKGTETIIRMLEDFLKNAHVIHSITMDSGSEFTNLEVVTWFEDNEIETYYVVGDSHKLGIINRFHRTLKDKLLKHFLSSNSNNWINDIKDIVKNYNNTVNRGTGFTPMQATKDLIQSYIISRARDHNEDIGADEIVVNVGDTCRVKNKKNQFDKMQLEYSDDTYVITKVNKNTVDLKNDKKTLEGIKKDDIILVNAVEAPVSTANKKQAERNSRDQRILNKEGIEVSNIIETKRKKF